MADSNAILDRIMARTIEVGDCLEWQGYFCQGKHPQINLGAGRVAAVRRVLWEMDHGPVPPGLQVGVTCGNWRCVCRGHIAARTRSKASRGRTRSLQERINIAAGRRAGSRLTMDDVRTMRTSEEPVRQLAARYGVSWGYVWRIRRGEAWADTASPWSGLGRAAAA